MATIYDYLNRKARILSQSGPNVFIECPGCGTRKLKCSVHLTKGIGNCFRASCRLHGGYSFVTLITYIENVGYGEAYGIAAQYQDEVEIEYKAKSYGTNRNYPKNSLPLQELIYLSQKVNSDLYYDLVVKATEYLVFKRKLTLEEIERYKIGVGYEDFELDTKRVPRFGMIVIPVLFNNQVVSYVERSVEVGKILLGKIKHYKPVEAEDYLLPSEILFNCDVAIPLARQTGILPIFEDAWSAIKLGGVGTLDSNLSEEQIFILKNNYSGAIAIVRDNDAGGREAAKKDFSKLIKLFEDVRIVEVQGVDPDDHLEDTKQRIANSKPIDRFEFEMKNLVFR